jgi:hypothetical protein
LAAEFDNDEPAMALAYSRKFVWECFHQPSPPVPDDPFCRWLRDNKSVKIDWSAFGIETTDLQTP